MMEGQYVFYDASEFGLLSYPYSASIEVNGKEIYSLNGETEHNILDPFLSISLVPAQDNSGRQFLQAFEQ